MSGLNNIEIKIDKRNLVDKLKGYFDKKECICLIFALVGGLFAHLYAIVNDVYNYDSIKQLWYGDGITSGRWFLQFLGDLSELVWGGWHVDFFNRTITLVILVFVAGMIPKIFNIKNMYISVIASVLFVVYPTSTSMMFFSFTSVYYAIAILMIAFAVLVLDVKYVGPFAASVLITYATGIYQASLTFAATLVFIKLIILCLEKRDLKFKSILKKSGVYFLVIVIAYIHYYLMTKITIYIYGDGLTSYQNIDSLGLKKIGQLPNIILETWKGYFEALFLKENHGYGISLTGITRVSALLFLILSIVIIGHFLLKKYEAIKKFYLIILFVVFPIVVNSINISCYGNWIYTLMVYAFYGSLLLPLLLLDLYIEDCAIAGNLMFKRIGELVKLLQLFFATLVCFNYAYQSNGNYLAMHQADQIAANKIMLIMSQVYDLDGYKPDMRIVFVNSYSNEQNSDILNGSPFHYGGQGNPLNHYTINSFAETYIGIYPNISTIYTGSTENYYKIDSYNEDKVVKNMPLYPENGSIRIYNDEVIVKFNPEYLLYE